MEHLNSNDKQQAPQSEPLVHATAADNTAHCPTHEMPVVDSPALLTISATTEQYEAEFLSSTEPVTGFNRQAAIETASLASITATEPGSNTSSNAELVACLEEIGKLATFGITRPDQEQPPSSATPLVTNATTPCGTEANVGDPTLGNTAATAQVQDVAYHTCQKSTTCEALSRDVEQTVLDRSDEEKTKASKDKLELMQAEEGLHNEVRQTKKVDLEEKQPNKTESLPTTDSQDVGTTSKMSIWMLCASLEVFDNESSTTELMEVDPPLSNSEAVTVDPVDTKHVGNNTPVLPGTAHSTLGSDSSAFVTVLLDAATLEPNMSNTAFGEQAEQAEPNTPDPDDAAASITTADGDFNQPSVTSVDLNDTVVVARQQKRKHCEDRSPSPESTPKKRRRASTATSVRVGWPSTPRMSRIPNGPLTPRQSVHTMSLRSSSSSSGPVSGSKGHPGGPATKTTFPARVSNPGLVGKRGLRRQ